MLIETFKTFLPFVNRLSSQTNSNITTTIQTTNASTNWKIPINKAPSLFMIKAVFMEMVKNKKKVEKNSEISDFEVTCILFLTKQNLASTGTKILFDYL